ncbi:hypothetical protein CAPTEDRAFT_222625 [Capitella teleta]|uniref:Tubulin epsilon and delta complex protein 1 domain-containing protein n=1 Tax=Capitella teleta TaxID=283909 RepID=R7U0H7_CAPTE|nr:hypothetical protein CAPTEDRAFT_222625 [Capitella teleta]|eukprot:ELT99332.1 hypothetical protein CAPTEDRAFT_222625 [Capitella teleta]
MSQIRNTIELLTKILRENGTSKVKAETFRLAKFNDDNAVAVMWKLLFELLYFCEYGKIDDITIKASSKLTREELVVYVKTELQKRGFFSNDLSHPSSLAKCGSRELLLAFAWLLCREDIITRFMQKCTSPLQEQDTAFLYAQERKFLASEMPETTNPVSRVRQLLWLNNKLQLSLRSLYALNREKMSLQHKIHGATSGVSVVPEKNHLSMLEVFMLRKPELLKKNLQLLVKDNERLQNLLKWRENEDVFWRWMESVLDAKEQQKTACGLQEHSPRTNIPAEMISRLQASRRHLQDAICKYEAIVDKLDEAWESKSSEISEEELDTLLSSLNLELSIQKAHISFHNTQSYVCTQNDCLSSAHCPQLLMLQQEKKKKKMEEIDEAQDVRSEIQRMQHFVKHLQDDVYHKQESFKTELQNLSSHFRDAVCVPPMKPLLC